MVDNLIFLDAIPGVEDSRDYRYSQKKIDLKESVDLREWDSPVEDQNTLGSCVSNAITNAYELMVRRLYPDQFTDLSRLFLYYNSRLFTNSLKEDAGVYIRDGLKAASRYGICSEDIWPYIEKRFSLQPDPEAYVDGSQRLITRYESLYTLRDLIEVLIDKRPIVIGMTLYEDFMTLDKIRSVVRLPYEDETPIGSHAVVLLGYDLVKQLFLAKNSFGKDWGMNGYCWIPFEYVRTQVFEKWCFDISNQKTVDIDSKIDASNLYYEANQVLIETGPSGSKVHKITPAEYWKLFTEGKLNQ